VAAVADLGTGSGAIALALAAELPDVLVCGGSMMNGDHFADSVLAAMRAVEPPDELRPRLDGDRLSLAMTGRRNGEEFTRTNLGEIYHPIPRVIARASAGVTLHPGEVIGLGTVPNGCLLEQPEPKWLQPGDIVELEVEVLGSLRSAVVART